MTMLDNIPVAKVRFEPPSRLHLQLEEQAREIHVLRRRLGDTLDELGRLETELRAPPLGRQLRGSYADRGPNEAGRCPGDHIGAWWHRPAARPALRPAPGHRCAGLVDPAAPVVAVSMCGLERSEAVERLELVAEQQIENRSFIPLFITDRRHDIDLFRFQGYDVELLPTEEELENCRGAMSAEEFIDSRWAQLVEAWAASCLLDLGRRTLPERARRSPVATPRPLVIFWKDYRRYNPYQHLLYNTLGGFEAMPGTIEEALIAVEQRGAAAMTIFHLNWEEAVYRPARGIEEAADMADTFLSRVDAFIELGGRLIWTVHNTEPHENAEPAVFDRLSRAIAARAEAVIVHSGSAGEFAIERFGVDTDRLIVEPHGNYRPIYSVEEDSAAAKKRLGLPDDGKTVFGIIGNIRPYKNAPLLLEAFSALPRGQGRLLLSGRQEPALPLTRLPQAVRSELVMFDSVVSDEDMPTHIAACDVIVLPYRRILTSGSVMLALSLARPVIVPDVPPLRETVRDGETGYLFTPGDSASLRGALARFLDASAVAEARMRDNAVAIADLHDWRWIGRAISSRLKELLAVRTAASFAGRGVSRVRRKPA
ncbi:MAG: glycosyltransferase [Geminicoccaceae bacterium]